MPENLHKGANSNLFYFARENRKTVTDAENILWNCVRNRKLNGFKFRRQHPIADFVADFYCPECNLIVEVDGDYHNSFEQKQYDEGRTFELSEFKIKIIRFTNQEVMEHIDFVLNEIRKHLVPS